MKPNTDQLKAPGSKPNAQDDLKSLPMPELQAKLGSSPNGLSQAEAQFPEMGSSLPTTARMGALVNHAEKRPLRLHFR